MNVETGPSHPPRPMPFSLDRAEIRQYFSRLTNDNDQIIQFVLSLDEIDHWALDHDSLGQRSNHDSQLLLNHIENLVSKYAEVFDQTPSDVIRLLAHLTTSRCVYLLNHMAARNDHLMTAIDSVGPELDEDFGIDWMTLQRRRQALSRALLLEDVFSSNRLGEIVSILRGKHEIE